MAVTMGHPIAAIATGHGRSGIGILRMSGEGCIERAAKVFTRADGKPLEAAEDRKLVLGTMADAEGRPVDHCMAFVSHAPAATAPSWQRGPFSKSSPERIAFRAGSGEKKDFFAPLPV